MFHISIYMKDNVELSFFFFFAFGARDRTLLLALAKKTLTTELNAQPLITFFKSHVLYIQADFGKQPNSVNKGELRIKSRNQPQSNNQVATAFPCFLLSSSIYFSLSSSSFSALLTLYETDFSFTEICIFLQFITFHN